MLEPRRCLKFAMLALMMVAFVRTGSAWAGTRTVTNTNDSGPGSLRHAIAAASPGDTIKFNVACPAEIDLASTLSITTSLTISGPGASDLAIKAVATGEFGFQVFSVNAGVTATISGVTIENGEESSTLETGGGIYNAGTLTVGNSTVSNNFAHEGGGIYNAGTLNVINSTLSGNGILFHGSGGGIYNTGTATVVGSTLSGNSAEDGAGCGIYNAGTLTVTNSTISGSTGLENFGGGIFNTGTLAVSGSTLFDNFGDNGGGGIENRGAATISNSTLSGNFGTTGGGIDNTGTLTVTNSTLSGNFAFGGVGGIISNGFISGGTVTLVNTTLSGNAGADGPVAGNLGSLGSVFTIKNTIVANSPGGPDCDFSGAVVSEGYNLADDGSCGFTGPGSLNSTPSGVDPAGLQNNGGPTQTIALLTTSPALDAIPASFCTGADGTPLATDQRGIPRPQGLGCEIGAYEYLPITGPAPSSGTTCNGAYNGTFSGNLRLSAGQNCIFFNGKVTGNVQQTGGSLLLFQSQVGGNVQVEGGGTFGAGPGSTIDGNLQIQDVSGGSGEDLVCGTNVRGNLQVQVSGRAVLVGAVAPAACAGNAIGGNVQVQVNSGSTTVIGNTIRGNLQDQANRGPTQVFFNTVSGNLQCGSNTGIQGGGNTADEKQGQCAEF